jgi:hypothetical protein
MNMRFRFFLLTINNLLIPCVVTALTSDACIQVRVLCYVYGCVSETLAVRCLLTVYCRG